MRAVKSQTAQIIPATIPKIVSRSMTSNKIGRPLWSQILRTLRSYFANNSNDMSLETWQRLEFRNEYKPPQQKQLHIRKFI